MANGSMHTALAPIEEGTSSTLVGSIEVEAVKDHNAGHYIDRIVCFPPETLDDRQDYSSAWDAIDEGLDRDTSLVGAINNIFLNGCSGCQQLVNCQPSILRKSKSERDHSHFSERMVSFSSLEIREFDMTLGDHPAASSGPPVMLDWDSKASERVLAVDEYERNRSPRRNRKELKLSYRERKGILENGKGFSSEEVNQAWAEALRIRQQRQETLRRGTVLMVWDDFWESAQRKYNRMLDSIGLMV